MPDTKPCPRCGEQIGKNVIAHYGCGQLRPTIDPDTIVSDDLTIIEHTNVLLEAYQIYAEREKERGSMWIDEGRDKAVECASDKVRRLLHQINKGLPFNEDDALDVINYAAFAIRCNRMGRIEREDA